MKNILIISLLSITLFGSQIDMLEKACQSKSAEACYEIALLYTEGIGFEQNTTQAKYYYQMACNYGSNEACIKLDNIIE